MVVCGFNNILTISFDNISLKLDGLSGFFICSRLCFGVCLSACLLPCVCDNAKHEEQSF